MGALSFSRVASFSGRQRLTPPTRGIRGFARSKVFARSLASRTRTFRRASLALLLALAGCGGDELTQLFACYAIDDALVASDTVVRLCVTEDGGERVFGCSDTRLSIAQSGGLVSQAIVRERADAVYLRLDGELARPTGGGGTRVATVSQELIVPFAEGRIVDVTLRLDARCVDRPCPAGQTCVEGACAPIEVNERCLTSHGEAPAADCTDPRLVTACPAP